MERKQGQIPGTELPSIPDLEEASEAYRLVRNERQALNIKEADQYSHYEKTFERMVAEGVITIPADMQPGESRVIHRYEDGDGNIQDIVFTKTKKKLKTNKSKIAHAGEVE